MRSRDGFYLIKHVIRKCTTLTEALDDLTAIGLEVESRELFDFTERIRGFLCEKDRRNVGKDSDVPCGTKRQDVGELPEKERCDEVDGG